MPVNQETINVWLRLKGARQYMRELLQVDAASKKFNTGIRTIGSNLDKTNKKANAFRQSATIMRKSIVGLAGASLAFGAIGLASTVLDFEEAMARTKATLSGTEGFTDQMFVRLQDRAMEVATASRFSSTEVAQGTFELAAAGLKAQQVLDALAGTTHLAGAAQIEMAEAAKIQAITLNQFSLDATQAGRVADVLTKSVNEGAAQLPELANSLSYVGPVASAFGTNLEDVITALTLLGNKGIEGSKAGTSLRQFFVRITRPTKMVKEAFKSLNMSADDLVNPKTGNLYALPVLMDKLNKGLESVDPTQARKALSQITGSEALTSILNLLQLSGPEWDKMSKSIRNSEGAAEEFSQIMMDTVRGRLDEFINTLQNFGIIALRKFSPDIKSALQTATRFVGDLTDEGSTARKTLEPFFNSVGSLVRMVGTIFKAAWPAVVVGLGIFFTMFRPIAPLLEKTADILEFFSPVLEAFLVGFVAVIVPLYTLKTGVAAFAGALGLLKKAMVLTPFGWWMVAIIALAYGVYQLYKRSETFRNIVHRIWDTLKSVGGWIKNNWSKIILGFLKYFTPIGIAVNTVKNVWDVLVQAFKDFWAFLNGDWSKLKDLFATPFKLAWAIIKPIVEPMLAAIDKVRDFLGNFGIGSSAGVGQERLQESIDIWRNITQPPGAAVGGLVTAGGTVLVGERGPELVSLDSGARVVPLRTPVADAGNNVPRDAGGPDLVVLRVDLDGRTIAETTHNYREHRKARR